jgi:hypothetical protein
LLHGKTCDAIIRSYMKRRIRLGNKLCHLSKVRLSRASFFQYLRTSHPINVYHHPRLLGFMRQAMGGRVEAPSARPLYFHVAPAATRVIDGTF